jgi:hypothetical protein
MLRDAGGTFIVGEQILANACARTMSGDAEDRESAAPVGRRPYRRRAVGADQ